MTASSYNLASPAVAALAVPHGTRFHTDFTCRPDGIAAIGDEGAPLVYALGVGPVQPLVIDGGLTITEDGPVATSYTQQAAPEGETFNMITGEWVFDAGTDNGSAGLMFWQEPIGDLDPTPDSPCHFIITPTGWSYDVWVSNSITTLAFGSFDTPLADDGETRHRATVILVGDTAHLLLPDGSVHEVTDSRIGSIPADTACWQTFLFDAGDVTSKFLRIGADTTSPVPDQLSATDVVRLVTGPEQPQTLWAATWAPGSRSTVNLGSSAPAELNSALRIPGVIYPPSGRLLVEVSLYVSATSSSWVIVTIAGDSAMTNQLAGQTMLGGDGTVPYPANAAYSGTVYGSGIITGTPGDTEDLFVGAWCPTGTARVLADLPYGYFATVKVSALP